MSLERADDGRYLNLVLRDSLGGPLAARPYTLSLPDGTELTGETDGTGRLPAGPRRPRHGRPR